MGEGAGRAWLGAVRQGLCQGQNQGVGRGYRQLRVQWAAGSLPQAQSCGRWRDPAPQSRGRGPPCVPVTWASPAGALLRRGGHGEAAAGASQRDRRLGVSVSGLWSRKQQLVTPANAVLQERVTRSSPHRGEGGTRPRTRRGGSLSHVPGGLARRLFPALRGSGGEERVQTLTSAI